MTLTGAIDLVTLLRQMTDDDSLPGAEAIAGWRVHAAEHGDAALVDEIDTYDAELLVRLWDDGGSNG